MIAVAPATLAVGNGGVLKTARFGRSIDSHTAVFRANQAPVKTYEVWRCRLTPGECRVESARLQLCISLLTFIEPGGASHGEINQTPAP